MGRDGPPSKHNNARVKVQNYMRTSKHINKHSCHARFFLASDGRQPTQ